MHQDNFHKNGYDFTILSKNLPELSQYIVFNKAGVDTIDFANPIAVKLLNKALLRTFYRIDLWDLPEGYLCPPLPGRAEYIHQLAEFLNGKGVQGKIRALDIGTGANCIYPIVATSRYGWTVVGSEVDETAIKAAEAIVKYNDVLAKLVEIRCQIDEGCFFRNVVKPNERFVCTICNPPFYSSEEEAINTNRLKNKKLGLNPSAGRNFGGKAHELYTSGGELGFISRMIKESIHYRNQTQYFSTLVANRNHLKKLIVLITNLGMHHEEINMEIGNKTSRILVWWSDGDI